MFISAKDIIYHTYCQPQHTFVVGSMDEWRKVAEVKKLLVKSLERKIPVVKVWSVGNEGEALDLARSLVAHKRKAGVVRARGRRAHLLGERVTYDRVAGVF